MIMATAIMFFNYPFRRKQMEMDKKNVDKWLERHAKKEKDEGNKNHE